MTLDKNQAGYLTQNHSCSYCGGQANYYSKQNKRWRCEQRVQNCPEVKANMASKLQVSQKKLKPKVAVYCGVELCSYGCEQVAKWTLLATKTGSRLCCSQKYQACPASQDRRSKLMKVKYEDPAVREQFLGRLNASLVEKYGVPWAQQNESIREKWKASIKENHGVDHYSQTKEFKDLCRSEEFRRKCTTSGYRSKPFTLPSGRIIEVQGYEPRAITELLQTHQESDLVFGFDIPTFEYEFKGFTRTYYPDIFIKSTNTIVEVKSDYTYKADLNRNLLKEAAVLAAGYNFCFKIYEKGQ